MTGMGTELHQVGRRERKKAMTRASILQAAQELFLERGFDAVSVREIADQADVSPTTVFAHFPQKEALLFHEEDAQRERLVAAVRERPDGLSISEALKAYYRSEFVAMWSGEEAPLAPPRHVADGSHPGPAGVRLPDVAPPRGRTRRSHH
jgi:AcrR family transcriptional regulator